MSIEQLESNVKSYCRQYPCVFTKASGATLTDEQGREYIDFFSGAGALNYGHNNPQLKQSLLDYIVADGITHGLDFYTSAKNEFMGALSKIILAPRGLDYKIQFTGPTGTNAVEAAFKIARNVTKRHNIIAFTRSFHGVSIGSLAATANSHFRDASGLPLTGVSFMPYDGYMGELINTAEYLEQVLSDNSSGMDLPAAVIVETVQAEGGVNVASTKWLQALSQVCKKHDILLIVDDIQVGCGRTGAFFSFEDMDIYPDIVVLSKSLSGYGLPLSIVLLKPHLDIWKAGQHNGTFRGNNFAFVTAKSALERYWQDNQFIDSVNEKAKLTCEYLNAIAAKFSGLNFSVRGRGMIQGLDLNNGDLAQKVVDKAFENRLIVENCGVAGRVIKFLPPINIENDTLNEGLKRLEISLTQVITENRN